MNFIEKSRRILSKDRNITIKVSSNLDRFRITCPITPNKETIDSLQLYGNYIMNHIVGTYDSLMYFNNYYKTIPTSSENRRDVRLAGIISERIKDCLTKLQTVVDVHLLSDSILCLTEKEVSFHLVSETFRI